MSSSPDPNLGRSDDAPYLPPVQRPQPQPQAEPVFDAKAMVDAMHRKAANPTYGSLPTGTPESRAQVNELREQARRKRKRNKMVGWFVALLFLGGIIAAGYFAYRAYQDDQEEFGADRAAAQLDDDDLDDPAGLTPLGEQAEIIEGLDTLNDTGRLGGGGLLDIIDEAEDVVGDVNEQSGTGDTGGDTPPPAPALAPATVLPESALAVATPLEAVDGLERYVVSIDDFAAAGATEYLAWLQLMQSQPQVSPNSPVFDVLPPVRRGQVAIAIARDGERLTRLIVTALEPDLHVDWAS